MFPDQETSLASGIGLVNRANQPRVWLVLVRVLVLVLALNAPSVADIGTRLVPGDSIDSAVGYVYVYQGYFPGAAPQAVTDWAFFNNQPSNHNWVTPLILEKQIGNQWKIVGIGASRQNAGTGAQHYPFEVQAGTNLILNPNGYTFGWWNGRYKGASNSGVVEFNRVDSQPGFAESCATPGCGNGGNIPPEVGLSIIFANDYRGPNPTAVFNSGYGRMYSVAFFSRKARLAEPASAPPEHTRSPSEGIANVTSSFVATDLPATGPQPWVVDKEGKIVPLYKASYALLISESSYPGGDSKWPALRHTGEEMDRLAAVLRTQGFFVRRVSDVPYAQLEPVIRSFIGAFGWDADTRILVYYSGHGYTLPGTDYSYVVPIDAPDPGNRGAFFAKAISLASFDTLAREFPARHALFIFDSCFSGGIFLSKGPQSSPPAASLQGKGRVAFFLSTGQKPVRQFIAAGGPDQTLPAKSTFLDLLIDVLQGRLDRTSDGYVTGRELGAWLEENVPAYVPPYAPQNPHSDLIRDPKFVFGDMVFQVSRNASQ